MMTSPQNNAYIIGSDLSLLICYHGFAAPQQLRIEELCKFLYKSIFLLFFYNVHKLLDQSVERCFDQPWQTLVIAQALDEIAVVEIGCLNP